MRVMAVQLMAVYVSWLVKSNAAKADTDYYLENGDVSSLEIDRFETLYDLQKDAAAPN